MVWRVSWREGSIYRRGRSERQVRGIVAKCSASLARAGGGRRGTRLAAGAGFAQGLQRGCRDRAVGLALSLRASALAGGGGSGLARRAARPALPGAASAVQTRVSGLADGGSGIGFAQGGGRGGRLCRSSLVGIGQRATVLDWPRRLRWSEPGRGRESAGTASALCSLGTAGFAGRGGNRGQRLLGRLGNDDLDLAR
uniref:Uncharacterized protein n=1 Tax=Oryza glumipatula TaxID=40148 RepID=A0A0D9YRQ8_9ORYZ